jgi:hypothetical protein
MSRELATQPGAAVQAAPLTNAISPLKATEAMVKSGYFKDVKSMAQGYVKVLAGEELGLTPFASMTGLTIIEGRLGMTSNLMATLLQEHPDYDYKVVESSNEKCVLEFYALREGREDQLGVSEFAIADAERAGLVKQKSNWEKWPKAMCFARALTQGIRTFCPVVTKGSPAYTVEELGVEVNESGEPVNTPVTQPNEAGFDEEVAEVQASLDEDKIEHLAAGVEALGMNLDDLNMLLGANGIDAADPVEGYRKHFATLTEEQFEVVRVELDRLATLDAEAQADAEMVEDAEVIA